MARREYQQFCPAARALDLVGERWTLLLVRELLLGPRRYTDLLEGLPGIGTNLLAARLQGLEEAGLVRRRQLPAPAASAVYELTEAGAGLEPVVMALARFGFDLLGPEPLDAAFRPEWLALSLRALFDREAARGLEEEWELRVDGTPLRFRVADGELEIRRGKAVDPAATIETDAAGLLALGRGELTAGEAASSGRVRISGDPTAAERFLRVLPLDRRPD